MELGLVGGSTYVNVPEAVPLKLVLVQSAGPGVPLAWMKYCADAAGDAAHAAANAQASPIRAMVLGVIAFPCWRPRRKHSDARSGHATRTSIRLGPML